MFWLESYKNVRMFSTILNRPLILLPNNWNNRTEKLLKPPSAVQLNVSLCWKRYPVKCRWGGTWKAATGSRYSYVLVLNSLMPYNDSNAQNDSPSCVFRIDSKEPFFTRAKSEVRLKDVTRKHSHQKLRRHHTFVTSLESSHQRTAVLCWEITEYA